MNAFADDLWSRAVDALAVCRHDLPVSADAAASRAYYAVFYAASAHFALNDQTFRRHSAVEAAVHRDLVNAGLITREAGQYYSNLARLRRTSDYGGPQHAGQPEAEAALQQATRFIKEVAALHPHEFYSPPAP